MKAIFTLTLGSFILLGVNAQTPEVPAVPEGVTAPEVTLPELTGAPDAPGFEDDTTGKKTTKLSFGNVKVIIYEEDEDVQINVGENGDTTIILGDEAPKKKKFYGTWSGLSLCGNGALTYDNQTTLPEEMRFMEIDYARSISAALNFAQLGFGFGTPHVGITTGLGIQWNRYGLKNNYNLAYNEDSLYGISTPDYNYSRNVLKSTYITMPLLLEFHSSKKCSKSFNIAVGVIGGYKLGSKLKQDYEFEGREYEFKTRGHYHFNPFQAYATARIGYGGVQLFANYGLTRVFEEGRGPQLYPFQVGLHFNVD